MWRDTPLKVHFESIKSHQPSLSHYGQWPLFQASGGLYWQSVVPSGGDVTCENEAVINIVTI